MIDLQQIRDELQTRNLVATIQYAEPAHWTLVVAAVAASQQMTVEHVHIEHHVRRVQILCDGALLAETVFADGKSLPALQSYYRQRRMMGLE